MNFSRGLFRAWVAFSLIWVCLICVIFFANGQQYFKPIRLTVAGSNFEFPGTTSRSAVKAALVSFFEREKFSQMDAEQSAAEISQKFASQDFPEFALQVSAFALVVPAIVFALGALLLWIGAGFRQPSGRLPG